MQHSKKKNNPKILSLTIRPTNEFIADPNMDLGGSSFSVQCFDEVQTKQGWVGKCTIRSAVYPFYGRGHYYNEYKEWLGLAMNRLLGIPTPDVAMSLQKPKKKKQSHLDDVVDYDRPCLHVMTSFIDGYTEQGEDFQKRYKAAAAEKKAFTVLDKKTNQWIPLKRLGASLAASCLLYDVDCLGHTGKNTGFVITKDSITGLQAKIIKIDTGMAFAYLANFEEKTYQHDPRYRDVRYSPQRKDELPYNQLTPNDQAEFIETIIRIAQMPYSAFKALTTQATPADGTGLSTFQENLLLYGLMERRKQMVQAYAAEIIQKNPQVFLTFLETPEISVQQGAEAGLFKLSSESILRLIRESKDVNRYPMVFNAFLKQFKKKPIKNEVLSLRETKLTDDQLYRLAKTLENNKTIRSLDLQDNRLTTESVYSLKSLLSKNKTIHSINLSNNPLDSDGTKLMKEEIELLLNARRLGVSKKLPNSSQSIAQKEKLTEEIELKAKSIPFTPVLETKQDLSLGNAHSLFSSTSKPNTPSTALPLIVNPAYYYRGDVIVLLWEKALHLKKCQFFIKENQLAATLFGQNELNATSQQIPAGLVLNADGSLYQCSYNQHTLSIAQAMDAQPISSAVESSFSALDAALAQCHAWQALALKDSKHYEFLTQHTIVMPYHNGPNHWNLACLDIDWDGDEITAATLTVYEPLHSTLTLDKLRVPLAQHLGIDVAKVTLKPICTFQQYDNTSCGAISGENGAQLITENKPVVDQQLQHKYPKGAEELRQLHLTIIDDNRFTQEQRANRVHHIPKKQFKLTQYRDEIPQQLEKFLNKEVNLRESLTRHVKNFLDLHQNNQATITNDKQSSQIQRDLSEWFRHNRQRLLTYTLPSEPELNLFNIFFNNDKDHLPWHNEILDDSIDVLALWYHAYGTHAMLTNASVSAAPIKEDKTALITASVISPKSIDHQSMIKSPTSDDVLDNVLQSKAIASTPSSEPASPTQPLSLPIKPELSTKDHEKITQINQKKTVVLDGQDNTTVHSSKSTLVQSPIIEDETIKSFADQRSQFIQQNQQWDAIYWPSDYYFHLPLLKATDDPSQASNPHLIPTCVMHPPLVNFLRKLSNDNTRKLVEKRIHDCPLPEINTCVIQTIKNDDKAEEYFNINPHCMSVNCQCSAATFIEKFSIWFNTGTDDYQALIDVDIDENLKQLLEDYLNHDKKAVDFFAHCPCVALKTAQLKTIQGIRYLTLPSQGSALNPKNSIRDLLYELSIWYIDANAAITLPHYPPLQTFQQASYEWNQAVKRVSEEKFQKNDKEAFILTNIPWMKENKNFSTPFQTVVNNFILWRSILFEYMDAQMPPELGAWMVQQAPAFFPLLNASDQEYFMNEILFHYEPYLTINERAELWMELNTHYQMKKDDANAFKLITRASLLPLDNSLREKVDAQLQQTLVLSVTHTLGQWWMHAPYPDWKSIQQNPVKNTVRHWQDQYSILHQWVSALPDNARHNWYARYGEVVYRHWYDAAVILLEHREVMKPKALKQVLVACQATIIALSPKRQQSAQSLINKYLNKRKDEGKLDPDYIIAQSDSNVVSNHTVIDACKQRQAEFRHAQATLVKAASSNNGSIFAAQKIYTKTVMALIHEIGQHAYAVLGPAPCEFTLAGVGSIARLGLTPGSDIDLGMLVPDATAVMRMRNSGYLKAFLNFIQAHLAHLTIEMDAPENAFVIEGHWLATPEQWVAWATGDEALSNTENFATYEPLHVVTLYHQGNDLTPVYQTTLHQRLTSPISDNNTHTYHHQLGMTYLDGHRRGYQQLVKTKAQAKALPIIHLKDDYLRPALFAVLDIALAKGVFNVDGISLMCDMHTLLDSLDLSDALREELTDAFEMLYRLRIRHEAHWLAQSGDQLLMGQKNPLKRYHIIKPGVRDNQHPNLQISQAELNRLEYVETLLWGTLYRSDDWMALIPDNMTTVVNETPLDWVLTRWTQGMNKILASQTDKKQPHQRDIRAIFKSHLHRLFRSNATLDDHLAIYRALPDVLKLEYFMHFESVQTYHLPAMNKDEQAMQGDIYKAMAREPRANGLRPIVEKELIQWDETVEATLIDQQTNPQDSVIQLHWIDRHIVDHVASVKPEMLEQLFNHQDNAYWFRQDQIVGSVLHLTCIKVAFLKDLNAAKENYMKASPQSLSDPKKIPACLFYCLEDFSWHLIGYHKKKGFKFHKNIHVKNKPLKALFRSINSLELNSLLKNNDPAVLGYATQDTQAIRQLRSGLLTFLGFKPRTRPVFHLTLPDNGSGKSQGLYIKFFPDSPSTQWAVSQLSYQVTGSAMPVTLGFLQSSTHQFYDASPLTNHGQQPFSRIPVVITKDMGLDLATRCQHDPSNTKQLLSQLNPMDWTLSVFATLVLHPEDDQPVNLALRQSALGKGQQIVMIDADHAFYPPVIPGATQWHSNKAQLKSFLLCLDQMNQPLDRSAVSEFSRLNPTTVMHTWLNNYQALEHRLLHPSGQSIDPKLLEIWEKHIPKSVVRPRIQKAMLHQVYRSFRRLHELVSDIKLLPKDHRAVMRYLYPELSQVYDETWNCNQGSNNRFNNLRSTYEKKSTYQGMYIVSPSKSLAQFPSIRETSHLPDSDDKKPLSIKKAVSDEFLPSRRTYLTIRELSQDIMSLKKGSKSDVLIKKLAHMEKNQLDILERILTEIDWRQLNEETVKELLTVLSNYQGYRRLALSHAVYLKDWHLNKQILVNASQLRQFYARGAIQLTGDILNNLSSSNKHLEAIALYDMPAIVKISPGILASTDYPNVRQWVIDGAQRLTHIEITAPQLEVLSLKHVPNLQVVAIGKLKWIRPKSTRLNTNTCWSFRHWVEQFENDLEGFKRWLKKVPSEELYQLSKIQDAEGWTMAHRIAKHLSTETFAHFYARLPNDSARRKEIAAVETSTVLPVAYLVIRNFDASISRNLFVEISEVQGIPKERSDIHFRCLAIKNLGHWIMRHPDESEDIIALQFQVLGDKNFDVVHTMANVINHFAAQYPAQYSQAEKHLTDYGKGHLLLYKMNVFTRELFDHLLDYPGKGANLSIFAYILKEANLLNKKNINRFIKNIDELSHYSCDAFNKLKDSGQLTQEILDFSLIGIHSDVITKLPEIIQYLKSKQLLSTRNREKLMEKQGFFYWELALIYRENLLTQEIFEFILETNHEDIGMIAIVSLPKIFDVLKKLNLFTKENKKKLLSHLENLGDTFDYFFSMYAKKGILTQELFEFMLEIDCRKNERIMYQLPEIIDILKSKKLFTEQNKKKLLSHLENLGDTFDYFFSMYAKKGILTQELFEFMLEIDCRKNERIMYQLPEIIDILKSKKLFTEQNKKKLLSYFLCSEKVNRDYAYCIANLQKSGNLTQEVFEISLRVKDHRDFSYAIEALKRAKIFTKENQAKMIKYANRLNYNFCSRIAVLGRDNNLSEDVFDVMIQVEDEKLPFSFDHVINTLKNIRKWDNKIKNCIISILNKNDYYFNKIILELFEKEKVTITLLNTLMKSKKEIHFLRHSFSALDYSGTTFYSNPHHEKLFGNPEGFCTNLNTTLSNLGKKYPDHIIDILESILGNSALGWKSLSKVSVCLWQAKLLNPENLLLVVNKFKLLDYDFSLFLDAIQKDGALTQDFLDFLIKHYKNARMLAGSYIALSKDSLWKKENISILIDEASAFDKDFPHDIIELQKKSGLTQEVFNFLVSNAKDTHLLSKSCLALQQAGLLTIENRKKLIKPLSNQQKYPCFVFFMLKLQGKKILTQKTFDLIIGNPEKAFMLTETCIALKKVNLLTLDNIKKLSDKSELISNLLGKEIAPLQDVGGLDQEIFDILIDNPENAGALAGNFSILKKARLLIKSNIIKLIKANKLSSLYSLTEPMEQLQESGALIQNLFDILMNYPKKASDLAIGLASLQVANLLTIDNKYKLVAQCEAMETCFFGELKDLQNENRLNQKIFDILTNYSKNSWLFASSFFALQKSNLLTETNILKLTSLADKTHVRMASLMDKMSTNNCTRIQIGADSRFTHDFNDAILTLQLNDQLTLINFETIVSNPNNAHILANGFIALKKAGLSCNENKEKAKIFAKLFKCQYDSYKFFEKLNTIATRGLLSQKVFDLLMQHPQAASLLMSFYTSCHKMEIWNDKNITKLVENYTRLQSGFGEVFELLKRESILNQEVFDWLLQDPEHATFLAKSLPILNASNLLTPMNQEKTIHKVKDIDQNFISALEILQQINTLQQDIFDIFILYPRRASMLSKIINSLNNNKLLTKDNCNKLVQNIESLDRDFGNYISDLQKMGILTQEMFDALIRLPNKISTILESCHALKDVDLLTETNVNMLIKNIDTLKNHFGLWLAMLEKKGLLDQQMFENLFNHPEEARSILTKKSNIKSIKPSNEYILSNNQHTLLSAENNIADIVYDPKEGNQAKPILN